MNPRLLALFFTLVVALAGVAPAEAASIDAPSPRAPLRPGDWWTYAVADPNRSRSDVASFEVLEADDTSYRVGSFNTIGPSWLFEPFLPKSMVRFDDASFDVDGQTFEPLSAPRHAGDEWETRLGLLAVHATIVDASATAIQISYATEETVPVRLHATYNPSLGLFTHWIGPRGETADLTARGSDGPCSATRVDGWRTLVRDTRTTAAFGRPGITAYPMDAFNVPPGNGSIALRIGAGGPRPGTYDVRVHAPDATVYEAQREIADGAGYTDQEHVLPWQAGPWDVAYVAGGTGSANVDLVGFDAHQTTRAGCATAPSEASSTPVGSVRRPATAAFVGAAVALVLLVGLRRRPFTLALFARLARNRVLAHRTRERIMAALRQEPGLTTKELRRRLELPLGTTTHHLLILESHGFATSVRWGRWRSWFASDQWPSGTARLAAAILRNEATRRILEGVRARPGANVKRVADAAGIGHSTVIFHLKRLTAAGLVRSERRGRERILFPT